MTIKERVLVWLLGNRELREIASDSARNKVTLERAAFLACVAELDRVQQRISAVDRLQEHVAYLNNNLSDYAFRLRRLEARNEAPK